MKNEWMNEWIEILGKRSNIVPVLFTTDMQKSLEILLSHKNVGVNSSNPNVFTCPNSQSLSYIRGCDTSRKHSVACGAKQPEKWRSTHLHHHIATISQLLNLKDNELDVLAKFIGHDVRMQREFYRLSQDTVQLTKVCKILLLIERGQIGSQ